MRVLRLRGELDVASCVILKEHLDSNADARLLAVDLRELEFIDSSGIGLLVGAAKRAQEQDAGFALVNGSGQVRQLLELTGLAEHLTVVEKLADLNSEP